MASYLFPSKPEDTPSSLFPSQEEIDQKTLTSQKFLSDVAERYSQRNNTSYTEVRNQVEVNGPDSVVPRTNPIADVQENFIDRAYSNQMSVEDASAAIRAYQVNTEALATATTATDVVESIIVDPYNPAIDRRAIDMHILNEEVMKIMPEDSTSGSVMSMMGMFGYSLTKGTWDNFMGTFTEEGGQSGRTREAFNQLAAEPNLARKREIAKKLASEMRDLGLYGDNKYLISAELSAIQSQGRGLNEGLWTAFDIATLGAGPVIKGIRTTGSAGAKALGISAARDVVDTAAVLKGTVGADAALTTSLKNVDTTTELARHTAPSMNRVASTTIGDGATPTINPVLNFELSNEYLESLKTAYRGQYITEESLNEATSFFVENYQKTVKGHVMDMTRTADNLDNYNITMTLGREDSTPFIDFFNAERFAKNIGGTVRSTSDGFVVDINKALSLKNASQATEASELRTFLLERIASPELSTSARLQTLLKRGTTRIGTVIQEVSTTHANLYKKLNFAETKHIDGIVKELRDGKDSYRRNWYSVPEFKSKYYSAYGKEPRQEVVDAYVSANKLSEAAWRIEADQYLKRATDQGQFMANIGTLGERRIRAIETYSIDRKKVKHIYDVDSGEVIELANLPKDRKIFQDLDGVQVGDTVAHYITADLKGSRPLLHTDVLGYQAGGSRGTSEISSLVVQEKTLADISGNTFAGRAKTFLAVRNEAQATKAVGEVNNILAAVRGQVGTKFSGKATSLKAAIKDSAAVETIIKANNGFNPSVETLDDFLKLMDDTGIGLDDVKVVSADDLLPKIDIGGLDYFQHGNAMTYRDLYRLNSNPTSPTRDKILFGYGGNEFRMPSPLVSVERDFARSVNYMAQRAYLKNASEGFVKGGKEHMTNYDQIKKLGVYEQVRDAKFADTPAGRAFEQERRTILSRLQEKNEFSKAWEGTMKKLSASTFGEKAGGKYDLFDKMSADPTVALRGFAFDLKLGMFNPDQYIVQGSSAASIIAIAPVHGLKAALAYPAMRAAMVNTQDGLMKTISKRVGSMMGMSEKDFVEMMTYVRQSGRFQIDQTVAEINGAYDLSRGIVSNIRQKGRVFFNEGERVSRLMAENVAYREFKATYPTLDVTTDNGFRIMDEFMTKRSDTLTMHMTSASAAGWQKGILSLPTQWQSYNARFIEALFFGRDLSVAEKVRLGTMQLVMYGSAGYGAGEGLNWLIDKSSTEMDPQVYTLLRYGLLDSIVSNLTGVDTAFGGRLGIGEGIVNTLEDIGVLTGGGEGKSFVEVLGGPSASIGYDSFSAGIGLIQTVMSGNISVAKQDLTKTLRNISSFDKGYRAMWMMQYGEYISKNRVVQAEGLSKEAAILTVLGAQLQAVNFQYDLNEIIQKDAEFVKALSKRIKELQGGMNKALLEDNDLATARDFSEQIATIRAPLTIDQQTQLNRLLRPSLIDFSDRLYTKAVQNNHPALANQLRAVTKKGEGQ